MGFLDPQEDQEDPQDPRYQGFALTIDCMPTRAGNAEATLWIVQSEIPPIVQYLLLNSRHIYNGTAEDLEKKLQDFLNPTA